MAQPESDAGPAATESEPIAEVGPSPELSKVDAVDVKPNRSLWLLAVAHAVNHAQAVVMPLIFLKIIDEFGVSEGTVAILAAAGSFASGAVQLGYASLTRLVSRRV